MHKSFFIKTLIPVSTIIIVLLATYLPLGLDYFGTIFSAITILIASAIEYQKKLFTFLGFKNFKKNLKAFFITAPLFALLLFLFYFFTLIPVIGKLTGQPLDFSDYEEVKGNLSLAIILFIFIWVSAAFCEEIIWRGYFMKQFKKFFGDHKLALIINILLFGFLFGYAHEYQGISGQIITGIIGMILSYIFYLKKYNLWFNVAIHGFFDTFALIVFYNGWF